MSTITLAPRPAASAPRAATSAGRRPAQQAGRVRLTRRGRLVVLALAFAIVAAIGIWLAAGSAATHEQGGPAQVEVVTVAPGDTLWDIAGDAVAATGEGDVRDMMERIQQLNTLDSSVVYAGQTLRVPSS